MLERMHTSKVWAGLAVSYGVFLYWYGGMGSPLSETEVEAFAARAVQLASTTELADRIRLFAEQDDGREFLMLNLNQLRDAPHYGDGRDVSDLSAEEVGYRYTRSQLPRLLSRACHPWTAVFPVADLGETRSSARFDRVTFVRYRSRRDYLELVLDEGWSQEVAHKRAAFARAYSLASTPALSMPGPRSLLLLLLTIIGLGASLASSSSRSAPADPRV